MATPLQPLLSVIVPVYNEIECLQSCYERITAVLVGMSDRYNYEIIFVDDGSSDASPIILNRLALADSNVRVLSFSRNFGHQIAVTAGLDYAVGNAVVIIDADLQDPPEVIPQFVQKWEEGMKIVYGVRGKRKGETYFKIFSAKIFYRLLQKLSDHRLPFDAGDFRLVDRVVVQVIRSVRERNRYMRGLIIWTGFSQCGVTYEREQRHEGVSKYTFSKMVKLAFDGLTSFTEKPLYLAGYLGLFIVLLAIANIIYMIYQHSLHPETVVPGWTSLLIVILFLGGTQLIFLSLLGLYIGRIYIETKQRPLYILQHRTGFQNDATSFSCHRCPACTMYDQ